MRNCHILAFPDFSKPFVLECDGSRDKIGAVLKQGQHPIDFKSRKLQPHEKHYFIYEKEILTIMHALSSSYKLWWETSLWSKLTITT